jgi:hypothetical protein
VNQKKKILKKEKIPENDLPKLLEAFINESGTATK